MSGLREWTEEFLRLLRVSDTFGEALQAKGTPLKGWFFRYVFGFSQNSCLHSVPLSDRSRMLNALLIGVGEKSHKLLCSKLVLCVLAMIFIQLMPLVPFDFIHVKNLF